MAGTIFDPSRQSTEPLRGHWIVSRSVSSRELPELWHGSNRGYVAEGRDALVQSNADRAYWVTGFDYQVMQQSRSDVAALTRFCQHIDFASAHLLLAFDAARVEERLYVKRRRWNSKTRGRVGAVSHFVHSAFMRWDELRELLAVKWVPSVEAEPYALVAFLKLSELTPAYTHLRDMAVIDWARATGELSGQLDSVARALWDAVRIADEVASLTRDAEHEHNERLATELQASLLERAGGGLTVREALTRLQCTRQNLHKRIAAGSVLSVYLDGALLMPEVQFVRDGEADRVVNGLSDVLRPFEEAGAGSWAALQFLLEIDPNLGGPPIDSLREGDQKAVVRAVRARLELDQE